MKEQGLQLQFLKESLEKIKTACKGSFNFFEMDLSIVGKSHKRNTVSKNVI